MNFSARKGNPMQATIGSISHGTLRPEDLISAFANTLSDLLGEAASEEPMLGECARWLETPESKRSDGDYLIDALESRLDELSPPFCYFGCSEGDGSDFGWWPNMEALDHDSEVMAVAAGAEPSWIKAVTDHGNVTLYRVTLEECWSIV